MKKISKILLLMTILGFARTDGWGQRIAVVQSITASSTLSATAEVVYVSGTNATTLTLPATTNGRVVTVINHSTKDVTFNVSIQIGATRTTLLLANYSQVFESGIIGNTATLIYLTATGKWHLIG